MTQKANTWRIRVSKQIWSDSTLVTAKCKKITKERNRDRKRWNVDRRRQKLT